MLKGKQEAVEVFEPLAPDAPEDAEYLAAYALMEQGDAAALPAFQALAGRRPDDGLVAAHLARLLSGAAGAVIDLR